MAFVNPCRFYPSFGPLSLAHGYHRGRRYPAKLRQGSNREDVALYLALRLQSFADALSQAGSDPKFTVSDKTAADEEALIETLNQFPSLINNDAKVKLDGCVATLSTTGTDRMTTLQPCIDAINKVRTEGMTTAAAAFSFQMASEASSLLSGESARVFAEGCATDPS